jgi:hypothetical protein
MVITIGKVIRMNGFQSSGFSHNPTNRLTRQENSNVVTKHRRHKKHVERGLASSCRPLRSCGSCRRRRVRRSCLTRRRGARIATVEELRALCEQAQCEIDDVTVTDLSVRRTLRAPPGKVGVEWAGLQAALEELSREGVLYSYATAELHEVLLYSPGDFFKPHTDWKKFIGPKPLKDPYNFWDLRHLMMLAVDMGLCAPSNGGELLLGVDEDLKEEWLPSGAGSFCAWGTNVLNEVKPLLSGNRCVAVYNVSASNFNHDGLRKRKHDSIVDALRLLVKEKANESSENSTKTHVGFLLESRYLEEESMVEHRENSFEIAFRRTVVKCDYFYGSDNDLVKALKCGFGILKEDLQVSTAVSLSGEDFREVHGDYIEEVPTDNANEEQSEQEEDNKESRDNMCNDSVQEDPIYKHATTAVTKEGSFVTVLAVDPEAKSPFQRYFIPADCYNSTWMLNAHPNSKPTVVEYFGYDPTTDNGTDLYLSCRIYLRVPRKYFPELNVPESDADIRKAERRTNMARRLGHRSRETRASGRRQMRAKIARPTK